MTGGMMFKGTPGPWTYDKKDGEVYSKGAYTSVAMALGGDAGDENGYLIAAAPDLFHVANLLRMYIDIITDGPDDSDIEMAQEILIGAAKLSKAAIAKALGEQK